MARRRVHAFMAEKRNIPVNLSLKEARRFPSAVRGVAPAASPARRRSSGGCGREGSAVVLCAKRCEEARRRDGAGKKEAPPLPYL